jgi:2-amino-4-hydroxy-6-hydroxymethyldihydropteridine diphosphokinase
MHRAYVGLGANLGARERTLRQAVELLSATPGVEIAAVSSFRETDPVGRVDQPRFLNGVVGVDTEITPRDLLDVLLTIERDLGRVRTRERNEPRTIDLDLLVYDDVVVDEPGLVIPHPRLHERRFVLEPLAELAPDLNVRGQGSVTQLLAGLD